MTFPLFGQGSGTPVQVLIGRGRPSLNISKYIDLAGGGLKIEDTGNQADDTASMEVTDIRRVIDDIGPEARILIKTGVEERFRGFARQFTPKPFTRSNHIILNAVGVSSLLDTCIIPPGVAYDRRKSESDRARILWLLHTFGGPFLQHASNDFSQIQVLERGMERQKFGSLTLRQAIEQVIAGASESGNYYVDQAGRIHTWDNDHEETEDAPYEINTAITLAANEAAPENLEITWDTAELINFWIVRGINRAGSGQFSDAESIELYGRRQDFIDGPDSDTARKARRLGRAALNDTKNPTKRVSFTVTDEFITRNGSVWEPGQRLYVTAPGFGWVRQRLRIVRVTTRYLDSTGRRAMDIEAGAFRRSFINSSFFGGSGGGGRSFPPGYIPGGPSIDPGARWTIGDPNPDPDYDPDDERQPCFPCPEGASMTPARVGDAQSGNRSSTFRPITVSVPNGADTPGRTLVFVLSYDQFGGADASMHPAMVSLVEGLGFEHVTQASMIVNDSTISGDRYGHQVFTRLITGGEVDAAGAAWGPSGASFELDIPDSIPDGITFRWATVLYQDVARIDGNVILHPYGDLNADPPGFTPPWNEGAPAVWLAHITTANAIFLMPTGYTSLVGFSMSAGQNNASVAERDGSNNSAPFDPPPFGPDSSYAAVGNLVLAGTPPREGEYVTDSFTGNGTTTTFSLTATLLKLDNARVDGVIVPNVEVSTTAHSVTFDAAPATGATVKVRYQAGQ